MLYVVGTGFRYRQFLSTAGLDAMLEPNFRFLAGLVEGLERAGQGVVVLLSFVIAPAGNPGAFTAFR